jgi:tetratricopeptide (TPR) repeat protein
MTLIKIRRFDEAQAELEVAIKNGGANIAQAHRFLGGLYQRAHRDKEAADEFETYLKLDPTVKDAETIKGFIKKLRGQG